MTLLGPITIQWEVTSSCNCQCIHCYNGWQFNKDGRNAITHTDLEKITDDIIASKAFEVVITGGEPLSVFQNIYPYLRKLREHGMTLRLNSNMTLFSEEYGRALSQLDVNSIIMSFPSGDENTYNHITQTSGLFPAALRGLTLARELGMKVIANMVLSQKNIGQVYLTASVAKEHGASAFSINKPIIPRGNAAFKSIAITYDEFHQVLPILKQVKTELEIRTCSVEAIPLCIHENLSLLSELGIRKTCRAGEVFCVIGNDGGVRPCIASDKTLALPVLDAWHIFSGETRRIPKECDSCALIKTCRGGCIVDYQNGSLCEDYYLRAKNSWINLKDVFSRREIMNEHLVVNPSIRFREELFGGILFRNSDAFFPLEKKPYDFIYSMIGKGFSPSAFVEASGYCRSDAEMLLHAMLDKKIIEEVLQHEQHKY